MFKPTFAVGQNGTMSITAPALGVRVRVPPGLYLMQVRGADVQVYNGPDDGTGAVVASTQCVTIANGRPILPVRVDVAQYWHCYSAGGAGIIDLIKTEG